MAIFTPVQTPASDLIIITPARAQALFRKARLIILDLDGTLMSGGQALPYARETLEQAGDRAHLLSNNSSDDAAALAAAMQRAGLALPPDRIWLAGVSAVAEVARRWPGARVMAVASSAIIQEAERAGLTCVDEDAEVVLLCRAPHFNYETLTRAANAVRRGAAFVAANPDLTHPAPHGEITPETGALAAAVAAAAGRKPDLTLGKPDPHGLKGLLRALGAEPHEAVMIGDNPLTDGLVAVHAGVPGIILSESLTLRDLLGQAAPGQQ